MMQIYLQESIINRHAGVMLMMRLVYSMLEYIVTRLSFDISADLIQKVQSLSVICESVYSQSTNIPKQNERITFNSIMHSFKP